MNTKFPVWLWLIGWTITSFALYATDLLENAWDYLFVTLITLVLWPAFMGLFISDVWMFVSP